MTQPQMSPQQKAQMENIRRAWQQRKLIADRLGQITTKIAVYSGKGGVGKTTVAVNLAALLAAQGSTVGILDADVDCPNVAQALGVTTDPQVESGVITPPVAHGVKVVSTAFFQQNPDEAIIWRGPMIHNALNQFLQMTDWGKLDYLIVDLPPGTSDAPLTIMQTLPLDGFIVVATPQELAVMDARRSINMIKKLNVTILGVVENYAGDVFGRGAGKTLSDTLGLPFLGSFELRSDYRQTGTRPTVLESKPVRKEYEDVVKRVKDRLRELDKQAP